MQLDTLIYGMVAVARAIAVGMIVIVLQCGYYLKDMVMNKICFFSFLLFVSINCSAQLSKERLHEERLKLKNYAFCRCLQLTYEGDSLFNKDGSSSGYFETGAYNIEVYSMVDSVSKVYSQKVYKSYGNYFLGIMKCLDFYNSNELKNLVKGFDKDIDRRKLKEN